MRCITISQFHVDELTLKIAILRIGRELADISAQHNITQLHELCQNRSVIEIKRLLQRLLTTFESPVDFSPLHKWVRTYSNVAYNTLEDNCLRFGIDLNALKGEFAQKSLHASLKDLVDMRNDIAHGSQFKPLTASDWEGTKTFVLKIMQVVQFELYESLKDETKVLENRPSADDFSI